MTPYPTENQESEKSLEPCLPNNLVLPKTCVTPFAIAPSLRGGRRKETYPAGGGPPTPFLVCKYVMRGAGISTRLSPAKRLGHRRRQDCVRGDGLPGVHPLRRGSGGVCNRPQRGVGPAAPRKLVFSSRSFLILATLAARKGGARPCAPASRRSRHCEEAEGRRSNLHHWKGHCFAEFTLSEANGLAMTPLKTKGRRDAARTVTWSSNRQSAIRNLKCPCYCFSTHSELASSNPITCSLRSNCKRSGPLNGARLTSVNSTPGTSPRLPM